jgi:hypothetical protein
LKLKVLVLVSTASLVAATSATAEIKSVSPGTFRCDMAPGKYDRQAIAQWTQPDALSGLIRMTQSTNDPDFPPAAMLLFTISEDESVGVDAYADPKDIRHVYAAITRLSKTNYQNIPFAVYPRDAWIPVSAKLNDGVLTATSGRFSTVMKIGNAQIQSRVLHCQSGNFDVNIKRGR